MPTCKAYLLRMLACTYNKGVLIGAHNVESNNPTDKKKRNNRLTTHDEENH